MGLRKRLRTRRSTVTQPAASYPRLGCAADRVSDVLYPYPRIRVSGVTVLQIGVSAPRADGCTQVCPLHGRVHRIGPAGHRGQHPAGQGGLLMVDIYDQQLACD